MNLYFLISLWGSRMKRFLLACFFLLLLLQPAVAQTTYPVRATPQLVGGGSILLTDYYSGSSPRLIVTVINADLAQPLLSVRLRLRITGTNGVALFSALGPTLELTSGVPRRLLMEELADYFAVSGMTVTGAGISKADLQRTGALPEGFYQICFEAFDAFTNRLLSGQECASAMLNLSDPPLLNQPIDNSDLTLSDPINLMFNWTPRHQSNPAAATSTAYEFSLFDITTLGAQNPQQAVASLQPIYTVTTPLTTLFYGPAQPALLSNRKYAWRVRAVSSTASGEVAQFRNNGISQVYAFNTKSRACQAPSWVNGNLSPDLRLVANWEPIPLGQGMDDSYAIEFATSSFSGNWGQLYHMERSSGTTFEGSVTTNYPGQPGGQRIAYRIAVSCPNGEKAYSPVNILRIPVVASVPAGDRVFTGKAYWNYRKSELEPASTRSLLQSGNPTESETTLQVADDVEAPKRPLPGAVITYRFNCGINQSALTGTVHADATGSFRIDLTNSITALSAITSAEISISHPSGLFSTQTLPSTANLDDLKRGMQDKILLTANSFRLQPSVTLPIQGGEDNFQLDILMPKTSFEQQPFLKTAGFGGAGTTVSYNNIEYIVLTTLNDGRSYTRLFYNSNNSHYAVRIRRPGGHEQLEPLGTFTATAGTGGRMPVKQYNRTFTYNLQTTLRGFVKAKEERLGDVTVVVRVNRNDISSADTTTRYSVTTDQWGYYEVLLPALKKNAVLQISASKGDLCPVPLNYSTTYGGASNTIQYNINFQVPVVVLVGSVWDGGSELVTGAQVSLPDGTTAVTGTRGMFAIPVRAVRDESVLLTVKAEGFVTQTRSVNITNRVGKNALPINVLADRFTAYSNGYPLLRTLIGNMVQPNGLETGLSSTPLPLNEVLPSLFNSVSFPADARLVDAIVAEPLKGTLRLKMQLGTVKDFDVQVYINGNLNKTVGVRNTVNRAGTAIESFSAHDFSVRQGTMTIKIEPANSSVPFLPFETTLGIAGNETSEVTAVLTRARSVNGVVRDSAKGTGLAGATIELLNPKTTVTADDNGRFSIIVPDRSIQLEARADNYNAAEVSYDMPPDTGLVYLNLERRPAGMPTFTTFAGFKANFTSVGPGDDDSTFLVSGDIELEDNEVFTTVSSSKTLPFTDVPVRMGKRSGNAVPLEDVPLNDGGTVTARIHGLVPVEMGDIALTGFSENGEVDREVGVLRTETITARLSTLRKVNGLPMPVSFIDADLETPEAIYLKDPVITTRSLEVDQHYPFAASGVSYGAISEDYAFALSFPDSTLIEDHLQRTLAYFADLFVKQGETKLDKDGFHIGGYVALKPVMGLQLIKNNMELLKFSINRNLDVSGIEFKPSDGHLIKAKAGRAELVLDRVGISGIGSSTPGISVTGSVKLLKQGDSLGIKELSFQRTSSGRVSMSAELVTGESGIRVAGLVFTTAEKESVMFKYDAVDKAFEVEASGTISRPEKEDAPTSGGDDSTAQREETASKLAGTLFPIEVKRFSFNTKTLATYASVKPNLKVTLGPMSINVSHFILNMGTSISLEEMNNDLNDEEEEEEEEEEGSDGAAPDAGEDPEMADADTAQAVAPEKISWAIGIKGGVELELKSITAAAEASLVIGKANGKLDFILNTININFETPVAEGEFELDLKLKGDTVGFSGRGMLKIAEKMELEAALAFYKFKPTNSIFFGAEVKLNLPAPVVFAPIPIAWHSFGANLSFNTGTKKFAFGVLADFNVVGTPPEVLLVKNARLDFEFDPLNCGALPKISGGATLVIYQEHEAAQANFELDVCNRSFYASLNTQMNLLKGIDVRAQALVYGQAPVNNLVVGNQQGSFFFGFMAKVNAFNLIQGNTMFALGYNARFDGTAAAPDLPTYGAEIPAEAKDDNGMSFTGIAASASRTFQASGSRDLILFKGGFSYLSDLRFGFFYKRSENRFRVAGSFINEFSAYGAIAGDFVSASVATSLRASAVGEYANNRWAFNAKAAAALRMRGCVDLLVGKVCKSIGLGLALEIDYKQGTPPAVIPSLSFD